MRIAYLVHQYLPEHVGGTELYTRDLAVRTRDSGHDVCVITHEESVTGKKRDFVLERTEHDGIPVVKVRHTLGAAPNVAAWEHDNPVTGGLVREALEDFKPDLVHVMHLLRLTSSALEAVHDLGIPSIVTLCDFWPVCPRHSLLRWNGGLCRGPRHEFDCLRCFHDLHGTPDHPWQQMPEKKMWRRVKAGRLLGRKEPAGFWDGVNALAGRNATLRKSLLRARRIIALSEFQRDIMVENDYPPGRIEACTHGLETKSLEDAHGTAPQNPDPVFTFIGGYSEFKGLSLALEAIDRLPNLNLELRVHAYGDPPENVPPDPRVKLLGTFPPEQLGDILASTDFLLVPSLWYENDPLVVKAALYVGVPVITGDIGCLPAMVSSSPHSRTVSPYNDLESWIDEIREACARWPAPRHPCKVKTIDENWREMLAIYGEVATKAE